MGRMNLSIYMKDDYEEFNVLRRRENKANQSQSQNLAPQGAAGNKWRKKTKQCEY